MTAAAALLAALGERVFAASVGAAILGIAVWAIARARASGLTPAMRARLWWLVAAKAMVALVWAVPVPWPQTWPAPPSLSAVEAPASLSAVSEPPAALLLGGAGTESADGESRLPGSGTAGSWAVALGAAAAPGPAAVLAALWLLGALASLAFGLRQSLATWALLRQAVAATDPALEERVHELARRLGYRGRIRLRYCATLDCPAVAGWLRPVLLVPAPERQGLDSEQWDLALAHELIHLRRRDLLWGLLPAIAERLFFFHPLVRRAAREYALARESACDLAVVAEMGPPPERYGRLLLRLGVRPLRPGWTLAAASPTHGLLKRRLDMLYESRLVRRFTPARIRLFAVIVALATVPWRLGESATAMMVPVVRDYSVSGYGEPGHSEQSQAKSGYVEPGFFEPGYIEPGFFETDVVEPGVVTGVVASSSYVSAGSSRSKGSSTHISDSGTSYGFYGEDMAFALMRGDAADSNVSFSGDSRGLDQAKRLRRAGEDVLWFRIGSKAYVVRDRAALDRFEELLAPQQKLGAEQGKLGERQGELGARQADLGARQGELGARQGELGARQAMLAADILRAAGAEVARAARAAGEESDDDVEEVGGKMEELAKEQARLADAQAELGTRQAELGARQAELGKLQAELGEQQAKAAAAFEADAQRMMESLVSSGKAEEVR